MCSVVSLIHSIPVFGVSSSRSKAKRDGHTHGLCAETGRPGEDLAGGQVLYEL